MADDATLKQLKKDLRKQMTVARAQLAQDERDRMDAALAERVLALPEYQQAGTVFAYLSFGAEVDTRRIIRAAWEAGKRVALPRCVPGTRNMDWYAVTSFDGLVKSPFGVDEPAPDPACLVSPADEGSSIALVPGFAFDVQGYRLGYGGGFYDVFLSSYKGAAVGLCRACFFQQPGVIPAGEYDLPVPVVAMDTGVFRIM